jgi:hypothetical protein
MDALIKTYTIFMTVYSKVTPFLDDIFMFGSLSNETML